MDKPAFGGMGWSIVTAVLLRSPDARVRADAVAVTALGVAIVYGGLRQGAYYAGDATLTLLCVGVAVVAAFAARAPRVNPAATATAAALLAFAAWTVVSAAWHGSPGAATAPVAVLCGIAASVRVAATASEESVRALRAVVLATGMVVAATGWAGVALHVDPWALVSSGLWRASSTLTYANATAAFLVVTLLLAVAGLAPRPLARLIVAVTLLGLLATMSRAGLLTGALGLAVLACSPAGRAGLARLWPALPAALVAAAGLLPALPQTAPPQPLPALGGLVAGAAVLLLARRRPRALLVLTGVAVIGALTVAVALPSGAALRGIVDTRITASSPERDDLRRLTLEQFDTSPVTGVGPGRLDFVYVDHDGVLVSAEYTHDEYLQAAAETGLIGLVLVLGAFVAIGIGAVRRRSTPGGPAALAVVTAFGVHSAFDFLWHIPVLPILVAVTAVPFLTVPAPAPPGRTPGEER